MTLEPRLNDDDLRQSKIVTKGQCMLIQRLRELLNDKAMASYKVKLNNSHTALNELVDVKEKEFNGNFDHSGSFWEEASERFGQDEIIQKQDPETYKVVKRKLAGSNSKLFLSDLQVYLKRIDKGYLQWCIDELKTAVDEENLANVNACVESLGAELIFIGWDKNSLYRLVKKVFIDDEVNEFEIKWRNFVRTISGPKVDFKVFVPISYDSDLERESIFSPYVIKSGEELKAEWGKNQFLDGAKYLIIDTKAYAKDLYSAIREAKEVISYIEGSCILQGKKVGFKLSKLLVELPTGNVTEYNAEQYGIITHFRHDFEALYSSDVSSQGLTKVLASQYSSIEQESINKKIKNVLLQYRLGFDSTSLEVLFSSFWFALEALVRNEEYDNIIENIIQIVAPIETLNYPRTILMNFLGDLYRCKVDVAELGISASALNESAVSRLIDIIKDNQLRKILKEKCETSTLLGFRFDTICKHYKNSRSLKAYLQKHYTNVVRHLKRIYYVRNEFVHIAKVNSNLLPIATHLESYLMCTVAEVLAAVQHNCYDSTEKIFACARFNYEQLMEKL
jgi:hypothetical protein